MGSVKRKAIEEEEEQYQDPSQNQQKKKQLFLQQGVNGDGSDSNEDGFGGGGCVHHVSYPNGYVPPNPNSSSTSSQNHEPAKKFPFPLDPFQSQAIACLENNESVMVHWGVRARWVNDGIPATPSSCR